MTASAPVGKDVVLLLIRQDIGDMLRDSKGKAVRRSGVAASEIDSRQDGTKKRKETPWAPSAARLRSGNLTSRVRAARTSASDIHTLRIPTTSTRLDRNNELKLHLIDDA